MVPTSSHTRVFDLDGRKVLFNELSTRLFVLNKSASFVWKFVSAGCEPEHIVSKLHERTDASRDQISRDVTALLDQWSASGLIESEHPADVEKPSRDRDLFESTDHAPIANFGAGDVSGKRTFDRAYRLVDYQFRLRGDTDLAVISDELLGHLALTGSQPGQGWPLFELYFHQDRWVFCHGNNLLDECYARDQITPMIHANILSAAFRASKSQTAIHAAAVSKGAKCVLLPARSGSGKSTLTAALIASGFNYCTDDLALLTPDPIRLRPAPLRMGIKSSSWEVLGGFLPALQALPVHHRADNKRIRYFLPPDELLPKSSAEALAVTAIVFPEFVPGSELELQTIERGDALLRMLDAGFDLNEALDREWVESTISWLKTLECHELKFDDLEQAVAAVASVLR